jgi:hypothetical protein
MTMLSFLISDCWLCVSSGGIMHVILLFINLRHSIWFYVIGAKMHILLQIITSCTRDSWLYDLRLLYSHLLRVWGVRLFLHYSGIINRRLMRFLIVYFMIIIVRFLDYFMTIMRLKIRRLLNLKILCDPFLILQVITNLIKTNLIFAVFMVYFPSVFLLLLNLYFVLLNFLFVSFRYLF